jgi:Fur family ferric uptake transcriptional regulator
MPVSTVPAFKTGLRENKRKLTRPRQAVLDTLNQAQRHLTPAEIYGKARTRYPHLGLATIYRTLNLLVELGLVQRLHFAEGCHSYALTVQPHGHHLVCSVCGRAEEFSDCDLAPLMKSLQAKTGFEINVHVLELMGRCPECRTRTRPTNRKSQRKPTQ